MPRLSPRNRTTILTVRASVLAVTLALVGSAASPASADTGQGAPIPGPPKIAIVPGLAVNVDAARVDALSQDLADALTAELLVEAVGGLEVRRRLPVDGLPADCIAKPACITDVARRLDASQLLFIVIVDTGEGGAVQIDSTWLDPDSGKSESRPAIDLAPGADPKSRFVAAARGLLPHATARPKAKDTIGTMTPAVPRHYTMAAKITTGIAVAGLGVGIGFGLAARSRYKDCDVDAPTAPYECSGTYDTIKRRALFADAGFAVAIGGAVATVILIATSGKESRLVVEPHPSGVAVTAIGRF